MGKRKRVYSGRIKVTTAEGVEKTIPISVTSEERFGDRLYGKGEVVEGFGSSGIQESSKGDTHRTLESLAGTSGIISKKRLREKHSDLYRLLRYEARAEGKTLDEFIEEKYGYETVSEGESVGVGAAAVAAPGVTYARRMSPHVPWVSLELKEIADEKRRISLDDLKKSEAYPVIKRNAEREGKSVKDFVRKRYGFNVVSGEAVRAVARPEVRSTLARISASNRQVPLEDLKAASCYTALKKDAKREGKSVKDFVRLRYGFNVVSREGIKTAAKPEVRSTLVRISASNRQVPLEDLKAASCYTALKKDAKREGKSVKEFVRLRYAFVVVPKESVRLVAKPEVRSTLVRISASSGQVPLGDLKATSSYTTLKKDAKREGKSVKEFVRQRYGFNVVSGEGIKVAAKPEVRTALKGMVNERNEMRLYDLKKNEVLYTKLAVDARKEKATLKEFMKRRYGVTLRSEGVDAVKVPHRKIDVELMRISRRSLEVADLEGLADDEREILLDVLKRNPVIYTKLVQDARKERKTLKRFLKDEYNFKLIYSARESKGFMGGQLDGVDRLKLEDPARYARLLAEARRRGITIQELMGGEYAAGRRMGLMHDIDSLQTFDEKFESEHDTEKQETGEFQSISESTLRRTTLRRFMQGKGKKKDAEEVEKAAEVKWITQLAAERLSMAPLEQPMPTKPAS